MNPNRAFAIASSFAALIALSRCVIPGLGDPHFELRGKHLDLSCGDCHGEAIGPLPSACQDCHEDDRPPDHYPGDCVDCHDESGWEFAVADHSFLPLTFSHDLLCVRCHTDPDAAPSDLDPACIACHADDEPPNHNGPTCESCHTWTTWGDVGHDHQIFPVPHEGEVSACSACHPNGTDTFVCIDCHEHNRTDTDDHHEDVSTYAYTTADCFRCHSDGEVHDN